MTRTCITEPISYLRLERYALQELPTAERSRIDQHLAECQACRECFTELQASDVVMPPLPAPSARPLRARLPQRTRSLRRIGTFASMLAAAAIALLVLRSTRTPLTPEAPVFQLPASSIKGGEIALQLMRERNGDIAREPDSYRSGDRFEVRVTCPPGAPMHWDVVAFQGGEVFFPLTPSAPLSCGNLVALPGAFRLTGSQPTTLCVALDASSSIDRAKIEHERERALPQTTVCTQLEPRE